MTPQVMHMAEEEAMRVLDHWYSLQSGLQHLIQEDAKELERIRRANGITIAVANRGGGL